MMRKPKKGKTSKEWFLWLIAKKYHQQWHEYDHTKYIDHSTEHITEYCNELRRNAYAAGESVNLSRYEIEQAIQNFDYKTQEILICQ